MTRKLLCLAIAAVAAAPVCAQDYDDRWYAAPYFGYYNSDEDRFTERGTVLFGLGFGRYINDNMSIEGFFDRTERDRKPIDSSGVWYNGAVGGAARLHFGADFYGWRPHLMGGFGLSRHVPTGSDEKGWDPFAQIGVGISNGFGDRYSFRTELAYRYDMDDETFISEDGYGDLMLNMGITVAFGGASDDDSVEVTDREDTVVEDRTETTVDSKCADDDQDGVCNADDKCPDTAAGQMVGRDGCPVEVSIDLRGVNFDFDKCTLRPDAVSTLDEAVSLLNEHGNIRVEVAGHTDWVGTDAYNQTLSECRARVVYDYLGEHGIDNGRLEGPNGYGESRPIDTNETAEGRARNRRTELNVQ